MEFADRRTFLKASALLPLALRRAMAMPAAGATGTIRDVEHVVILMQENRSFDHYFGMLRGVRGFSDPRAITLPSGKSVFRQPSPRGGDVVPFRLNAWTTDAQTLPSLDHSWKESHDLWKHHDAWIARKTELTMGYFTREDLPFYYALADAFTVCDAYHCSIFGPTSPNRLFLFTGTNGLAVGNDGLQAIVNPGAEPNETADQKNDGKRFEPFAWTTYAERLSAAGIDWKVYQEYDNYGDNELAYFKQFRGLDPASENYRRARSWAAGSDAENAKASRGEHLVAAFAADVAAGRLPQVSWIVAPFIACEHPYASPFYGEAFVSGLLSALASRPEVWAKTAFFLNYDENDGFFDHMPLPVPAISPAMGKSTVDVAGEIYQGVTVGLGPRVPMLIVSPWTKGGFVDSQVFDHTSVIRFLEARFGVMEPNITPWRRAVCGDLTSAFDFSAASRNWSATLPDTGGYVAVADRADRLPRFKRPRGEALPRQESGQRPARSLPYDLEATGGMAADGRFSLSIRNRGKAGAPLIVYAGKKSAGPWFYTAEAGKEIRDMLPVSGRTFHFSVHGPNGFLREFRGEAAESGIRVEARYDAANEALILSVRNDGAAARDIATRMRDYGSEAGKTYRLPPGSAIEDRRPIAASDHWYDLELAAGKTVWRFAGHVETGRVSRSDPALGRTEELPQPRA